MRVGEAHGGKDVGWLCGAGLAGAAGGDGDAGEIEGDEEGLGFEAREGDAGGVVDAFYTKAVDLVIGDLAVEPVFEVVAKDKRVGGQVGVLVAINPVVSMTFEDTGGGGEFSCGAEGYDAGDVFCAGAALALVGSAVEHGAERSFAADEEGAGALGGVELVAGEAKEVDVFVVVGEVDGDFAYGLDSVGVKESVALLGDHCKRCNALEDAGFVVGEEDGDEFCVGAESFFQIDGIDYAVGVAGEVGDFDALFFEGLGGVEDGVVLGGGGDEVVAGGEGAEEREVVGFGAGGGENDFAGAAVEECGELITGVVDGGAGGLALLVGGAGVAEGFEKPGAHGFKDIREDGSGGVGVEVDTGGFLLARGVHVAPPSMLRAASSLPVRLRAYVAGVF